MTNRAVDVVMKGSAVDGVMKGSAVFDGDISANIDQMTRALRG